MCSKIVAAQSPMAIVILTKGSNSSMKLRDGDISWHDFLETVKDFKYVLKLFLLDLFCF